MTPAFSKDRARRIALFILLAILGTLYGLTICRTVYWGDGMELTAAASCLGITHPPGYPLFVLIGRIFQYIPVGDPGFRMNLLSACATLLSAGLLFGLLGCWLRIVRPGCNANAPWSLAFRVGLALLFGLSRLIWQHAVMTEVYPLMVASHCACLWLILHTYETRSNRTALALAFAYGVAWQCHYMAIILAPAIGTLVLSLVLARRACMKGCPVDSNPGWPRWGAGKLAVVAAICFCIGASGYLAMPIRARQNPPVNWGDVSSPRRLLDHMSGGQFKQTKILSDPATSAPLSGYKLRRYLKGQALWIVAWPAGQVLPPSIAMSVPGIVIGGLFWLIALGGLSLLIVKRPLLASGLGASLALGLAVLICYTIPDIESYFQGVWPLALVLAGGAVAAIAGKRKPGAGVSPAAAILVLAFAALAGRSNFAACDLSDYREADIYGRKLLEALPENALLLTNDDNTIFAVWYQQTTNGMRPDVVVYGLNFVFRGWYSGAFETEAARNPLNMTPLIFLAPHPLLDTTLYGEVPET